MSEREQLEAIAKCDPSWLLMDIKENSVFDAAVLEKVFVLAKERASALLSASEASAEPVAWRYDTRQGYSYHSQQLDHFYTGWDGEYVKGEPLYARPAPAADCAALHLTPEQAASAKEA